MIERLQDLQEKVTYTGKELLSRTRNWRRLSTKPLKNCDIVVIFERDTMLARIVNLCDILTSRVPELIITSAYHRQTQQYALYISSSYQNLLKGAAEIRLRKQVLQEHGGQLQEFCLEDMDLFDGVMDESTFLTSCDRQMIIHHYLMTLRATTGDEWSEKLKFTNDQPIIQLLMSVGIIVSVFPLHEEAPLLDLLNTWVRRFTINQPIDKVKSYFGPRIALYFAWLHHYTKALLVPAILGVLCWLVLPNDKSVALYYPLLAFGTMLWSTFFLESWKRVTNFYTNQWGMLDRLPRLLQEPRPLFKGNWVPSLITGRLVLEYAQWKRNLIICLLTVPVIIICLFVVVIVAIGHIKFQESVEEKYMNWEILGASLLPYLAMILHALDITILNELYHKIAVWLTNMENHRLEEEHSNALVAKLILFQFVNSFYASFYIAFYQKDLTLLRQHLIAMLVVRQITGNLKEYCLPYGRTRLQQLILSVRADGLPTSDNLSSNSKENVYEDHKNSTSDMIKDDSTLTDQSVHLRSKSGILSSAKEQQTEYYISRAEKESIMPKYEDPSDDYLEMFIQFSFVSMFTCAFPICGLLAFLNNILEIRGDAFKLLFTFQRPFSQHTGSIGVWEWAFDIVSYVAITVNVGLISISGSFQQLISGLQEYEYFLISIFIEHIFFALRYGITKLTPRIPFQLECQIASLEHKRREALRTVEREFRREARTKSTDE